MKVFKKTRRIYLALKKYKLYLEILKRYKRDIQRRKKKIVWTWKFMKTHKRK